MEEEKYIDYNFTLKKSVKYLYHNKVTNILEVYLTCLRVSFIYVTTPDITNSIRIYFLPRSGGRSIIAHKGIVIRDFVV